MSKRQFTFFGFGQVLEILFFVMSPFIAPILYIATVVDLRSDSTISLFLDNWKVKINTYRYNYSMDKYLPWDGRIVKRLALKLYDNFYLIKLDAPIGFDGYETEHILLTKMVDYASIDNIHYTVQLFLIPKGALIDNDVKNRKGLGDMGYVWLTLEPLKTASEKEVKTES